MNEPGYEEASIMSLTTEQLQKVRGQLAAMKGKRLSAFRKSYGRTAHAHIGELIPRASPPPRAVYKDQGEFVVGLWDCDRVLTRAAPAETLSSPSDGDEPLLDAMAFLEGKTVSDVSLDVDSLTLRIGFSDGASVALVADLMLDPDAEQWSVTFPDGTNLVARGSDVLGFEP